MIPRTVKVQNVIAQDHGNIFAEATALVKRVKTEGYVYILTNRGMRGLIKIGRTTGSVEKRAKDLSSTGVPFPFEVAYKMKVSDCGNSGDSIPI